MILFPNCKINLGLNIVARRSDGFHDIETVFYPLPLTDILEMIPSGNEEVFFESSGLPIPGSMDQNLCVKAYNLLKDEFRIPGVKMHLHKVIPMGAGLGGGSSDGAYTLKLLNKLFHLDLDDASLEAFARQLGSDCAFFIRNQPVYASGKGDQFLPVTIDLTGYNVILVVPDVHIGTARAYSGVNPSRPVVPVTEVISLPPGNWREVLQNDFESSVFAEFPVLREIKNRLYEAGAVYASMTGSGSAVYALFQTGIQPGITFPGCKIWNF